MLNKFIKQFRLTSYIFKFRYYNICKYYW